MVRRRRGTHHFDLHPGWVPAGIVFDMHVGNARMVAKMRPDDPENRNTPGAEFAFIGLLAHFEGFCKNHAAALINIDPTLIRDLAVSRPELQIRPIDVVDHFDDLATVIGQLVVESLDFGKAKSINSIFHQLLGVTPLSAHDAKQLHAIIDDRNVIVHHGNLLVRRYASAGFAPRRTGQSRLLVDSINVTPEVSDAAADFLHRLSVKIRNSTQGALKARLKRSRRRLSKLQREALDDLAWVDIE